MRHKVYGKHLNRDKNERQALYRGLIRNLILQESITTTEAKVKAITGVIDKLISHGRTGSNATLNVIKSFLPQKEVSKKLIEDIAPRYKSRASGFTSRVRIGPRQGDGAMMVKISLVEADLVEKTQADAASEQKGGKAKVARKK